MIRFLSLKNQICEGSKDFAFYDTVNGRILSFGNEDTQVFSTLSEFLSELSVDGALKDRFLSLIPDKYFCE